MKINNISKSSKYIMIPGLIVLFSCGPLLQAVQDKTLPDYVLRELTHLEETYRILDITAEKIWPGWTNYRDFPFLLQYPNNLLLLIGHPNPPASFEKLPDLKVEDKEVYADFSQVNTTKVEYPLMAGGGPIAFGSDTDGKPVTTVMMGFMTTEILKKGGVGVIHIPFCAELQILAYIHELFHCFQPDHIQMERVGNLFFNPDAPYALYSMIEGYALLKAFQAESPESAYDFIRDFLAARMLKRKASMPELQRKQESGDELLEGTAVYTTPRTLEILSEGYETKQDLSKNEYYTGFKNAQFILAANEKELKAAAEQIYDSTNKCYHYGGFQALLLQKYFPGWQQIFSQTPSTLDKELAKRIPIDEKDLPLYEKRFRKIYGFEALKKRTDEAIEKRDKAYYALQDRSGTVYIINFKEIGATYEDQLATDAAKYTLGIINMYMNGIPAIKFDQTELSTVSVPVEANQFYYFKIVDTDPKAGEKPYSVNGLTQDGSIYKDAVITTPLFTLKSPLIRIDRSGKRIKFTILPVLKTNGSRSKTLP